MLLLFFFKQKTAYEMRISDWSSDVCSSDLPARGTHVVGMDVRFQGQFQPQAELMDQREVAFRSLEDRIDECAFPRFLTAEQISVGGGFRLEEQIGRASCRERVCQ